MEEKTQDEKRKIFSLLARYLNARKFYFRFLKASKIELKVKQKMSKNLLEMIVIISISLQPMKYT